MSTKPAAKSQADGRGGAPSTPLLAVVKELGHDLLDGLSSPPEFDPHGLVGDAALQQEPQVHLDAVHGVQGGLLAWLGSHEGYGFHEDFIDGYVRVP